MIHYGRQEITQSDIDEVINVLKSDYLTQGPAVSSFEQAVAKYVGAGYAVAVNSATSALHLACLALGVGTNDKVWTSPISFVASANCALFCNATIDFIDINSRTYNIDIDELKSKLEKAKKNNNLPKVIIPVHLAGQSCDMKEIYELSKAYGFKIIEDASHAIGGKYNSYPVGSCLYSHITVFSFHPVKIITTGEGGMAITNDNDLAKKMIRLRSHGITSDKNLMRPVPENELWNYQQLSLGFNYRMTDIQAALGLSQLSRLDHYVSKRHLIAQKYNEALMSLPLTIPYQKHDCYSSFHLYIIRLNADSPQTNKYVYREMCLKNIFINLHYIPIYRQPFFKDLGFKYGYCPEAEDYFSTALSLPIYPGLTDQEQDLVIKELTSLLIQ